MKYKKEMETKKTRKSTRRRWGVWVSPPRLSVQRAALLPRKGRRVARPKILRSEAAAPGKLTSG